MGKAALFRTILNFKTLKINSKAVSVTNFQRHHLHTIQEVLTAIYIYGHGSYQKPTGRAQKLAQQTVSAVLAEVTAALNHIDIRNKYVKFPQTAAERNANKLRFYEKFGIPGVVGCIDGTHVAIVRPNENEERYYCRKNYHSLNVQLPPTKEIQIPTQYGHIVAKMWGSDQTERPILALHGWQDNAGTWDTLAPMLCKNRSILAIDFPGHGFSSWLPPGVHYYPWELPRLILFLKNYFKWNKVSLLCHSMGSIAGQRFASVFSDDVDCYIAVDSIIYDDYDLDLIVEHYPKVLQKIEITMTRLNEEPPAYPMEELIKKWHLGTRKSVDLESVKYLAERGTKPSKADPNKYYFSRDSRLKHTLFQPESKKFVEALIRRLKCPTLYFKAIDSPYASDEFSIEMREIIEKNNENYEIHFVPGTHHVHLNNPEKLAPIIENFMRKHNLRI